MGTATARRDLAAEFAKHFKGTPEERLAAALRVEPLPLDLFLSTLPPGTSREELARLRTNAGRRYSRVMENPRG